MKILDLIPENELKDAVLSEYKKDLFCISSLMND